MLSLNKLCRNWHENNPGKKYFSRSNCCLTSFTDIKQKLLSSPLFFIPMGILTAANNSKSIIYQQSPIIVIHCYWVSEADSSPFYPRNFSVCFLPSGKAAQPFFRFLIFQPFSSDDVWISSQINLIFSSEWRSRSRFYLCGFHHDSRNGSRSRWDANVFDWKGLASALILRWWLTHYFLM